MSFNKPIKPAKDIEGVRRSAFWHLGRRDHSEHELRAKLNRKTDNQQWINSVIDECYHYDYLNDKRFIESFLRASQNKGYGATRIKHSLKHKGIDTESIQNTFENDPYNYMDSVVSLLERKFKKRISNRNIKQKAMHFLQNKGHNVDDILNGIEIHNESFPIDEDDEIGEAMTLLSRKFKTEIVERKLKDKAIRHLISKGYAYNDINKAIQAHNKQIAEGI